MSKTIGELMKEYHALSHAMQSGVEFKQDKTDQTPKHLRVGINAAMSDHGALVALLLQKGVFTHEEYAEKLVEYMRREVEMYQREIEKEHGGGSIKLV